MFGKNAPQQHRAVPCRAMPEINTVKLVVYCTVRVYTMQETRYSMRKNRASYLLNDVHIAIVTLSVLTQIDRYFFNQPAMATARPFFKYYFK